MRVFLRVLLALGLCVLLAGTVLAADSDEEASEISICYTAPLPAFESLLPDRPEEADPEELTEREAQWMERAWAGRDRNARERLCLRLLEVYTLALFILPEPPHKGFSVDFLFYETLY